MSKPRTVANPDRPTPTEIGTFASGGVPVRQTPIGLARLFFQICTTAAAETLAKEDLTTPQFGALVYLSNVTGEPGMDQNGLAARLGIDRASTSQLVEELVAMGFVDRRVNGADRRARLLQLTPRGERLRARLHPAQIASQMRVLAPLAPHERKLLLDLLVRVVASNSNLARPAEAGASGGHAHHLPTKADHRLSTKAEGHSMRSMKRCVRTIAIMATFAASLGSIVTAAAQAYPSRPITMIVPYPAGGSADVFGRIVIERMRVSLGQSIIVENVAGASGNIGVGKLARSAGDGYTFGYGGWVTHVVNGAAYRLPYDLVKDFQPVSLLASNPQLIVAKKAMPAENLKELIAWLKVNPDKASVGTSGAGGSTHIAGVLFQRETGTRFQYVAYRGSPQWTQDLIAGQIDFTFDQAASALPHVRAGNIKAYAVTSKSRLVAAPDIPTVDEAGLPGFYMSPWHAFGFPKPRRETSSASSMPQ